MCYSKSWIRSMIANNQLVSDSLTNHLTDLFDLSTGMANCLPEMILYHVAVSSLWTSSTYSRSNYTFNMVEYKLWEIYRSFYSVPHEHITEKDLCLFLSQYISPFMLTEIAKFVLHLLQYCEEFRWVHIVSPNLSPLRQVENGRLTNSST